MKASLYSALFRRDKQAKAFMALPSARSHPADDIMLQVTLRPHRSLSPRGLWLVVVCVAAASMVASLPFVILGYWPVAGFYGLDVALLAVAFRASLRASGESEELALTPIELTVRRFAVSGQMREWRFNPLWTRLDADTHEEFGIARITLASRGETVSIGQFLGPNDKERLFSALSSALKRAKSGPVFHAAD